MSAVSRLDLRQCEPAYARTTPVRGEVYQPSEEIDPLVAHLAGNACPFLTSGDGTTLAAHAVSCTGKDFVSIAEVAGVKGESVSYEFECAIDQHRITICIQNPTDQNRARITRMTVSAVEPTGDPGKIVQSLTTEDVVQILKELDTILTKLINNKRFLGCTQDIRTQIEQILRR